MKGEVLVPLDGSEHALSALPVARVLAELEGSELHVLHVAEEVLPPAAVLDRVGLTAEALAGSLLDVRSGDAADAIAQMARERGCGHIVLCTYVAAQPGKTIGHTALGVLGRAPCPVTLVRPERGLAPWALRKILFPHDGTPTTTHPIRPAAELARRAGSELEVLHIAAPHATASREPGALTTPRYVDQAAHEWPEWVSEFVERIGSAVPLQEIRVRFALASGTPAVEILRVARSHATDLVLLAWRGDWEPGHATIVKDVLQDAPCPVMVVHAPAPRTA